MDGISPKTLPMDHAVLDQADVKVLYVVGSTRSGSTLLGNVLGELDGFFHAGELRTIWGQGLLQGRLCGCGRAVRDCPLWCEVLEGVLNDHRTGRLDGQTVYGWQRGAVRMRNTIGLLAMTPGRSVASSPLGNYMSVMGEVYRRLAAVTSSRVIVDSSKREADAAVLRLLPGISTYYLHLVRDPRGVAYSWQRRRWSPGEGRREEMLRYGPVTTARSWISVNLVAEVLRLRHGLDRSLLVRYEDFVADPASLTAAVADLVVEPVDPPIFDSTTVVLGPNHTAGGNPNRLAAGQTRLHLDDEWVDRQHRRDRWAVTLLTAPLLQRYGYALRPART